MLTQVIFLHVAALLACGGGLVRAAGLKETFRWKNVSFAWESEDQRVRAEGTGAHREGAAVPVGLEVWEERVFVTLPRWAAGVAASLATFPKNSSLESPVLRPYPSWAAHDVSSGAWASLPERVVSPFRLRADRCGRLWVLDTGKADVLGDGKQLAPPALLVFDLRSDTLLRRFQFPATQMSDTSFLVNVAVDVNPMDCKLTYAYIADMGSYSLLVYSWEKNSSWRVQHNFFLSDPLQGEFDVHGAKFQWVDGLFGLALSKANIYNHRTLYFHAFSSTHEFQVSTEILQNETRVADSFHEFHIVGNRGPNTQSCASFMDEEGGIIFYTQVNTDSITCWNSRTRPHYMPSTLGLVEKSSETLVFPNDVKVDADRKLWVLSDKLPLFIYGNLPNDYNFRILSAPVDEAVSGTICDPNYSGPDPPIEDDPLSNRFGGRNTPVCSSASTFAATFATLATLLLLVAPLRR